MSQRELKIYECDVGELLRVAAWDTPGAFGLVCEYLQRGQGDDCKEVLDMCWPLVFRELSDDTEIELVFPGPLKGTVEMFKLTLPGPCFISSSEY